MTINQHNFEAYLLDYLEGNLDPLLMADLMAFLAENPEYEACIPDYDPHITVQENLSFSGKALLKKDFCHITAISPENFEEFCIADCEGLLSVADRQRLHEYVEGDAARFKTLDTYRNIRLIPDNTVAFSGKEKLKKSVSQSFRLRYLYYGMAIAASLMLFVMLGIKQKPAPLTTPVSSGAAVTAEIPAPASEFPLPASAKASIDPPRAVNRHSGQPEQHPNPGIPETSQELTEIVLLAPVDPLRYPLSGSQPDASALEPIRQKASLTNPSLGSNMYRNNPDIAETSSFLRTLIARIDFWKTAESALQGFNYLTEAQLSIDKQTDKTGKVTGLMLGMDNYTITGNKIK